MTADDTGRPRPSPQFEQAPILMRIAGDLQSFGQTLARTSQVIDQTPASVSGGAGLRHAHADTGAHGTLGIDTFLTNQYDGMQLTVDKRLNDNFLVNAAYTFGKSLEDASMQAGSGQIVQNFNDILADRGRTSNDRRHQFKASVVWNTNYFRDGSRVARAILDGWTVSGIVKLLAGRPLTITAGRDANGDGNSNDRADLVPGADPTLDPDRPREEVILEWFNTAAFAPPANLTDGNSSRNFIDGPGSKVIDIGLYRDFPVGGRKKLQLRMEATNAFNFVNLNNPNTNIRSASFGKITEAGAMRRIQLGARFTF